MPAPSAITYSAAAKIAANTEILTLLDAGSANATIKLYNNDDQLIADIPLADPAGAVNGTTGVLTLTVSSSDTALISAVCAYADISDSDGNVVVTLPVKEGNAPASGFLVLNSATIIQGVTVSILSAVIE